MKAARTDGGSSSIFFSREKKRSSQKDTKKERPEITDLVFKKERGKESKKGNLN